MHIVVKGNDQIISYPSKHDIIIIKILEPRYTLIKLKTKKKSTPNHIYIYIHISLMKFYKINSKYILQFFPISFIILSKNDKNKKKKEIFPSKLKPDND